MTNTSSIQDPANPKPKKRKERADDKVALTEKAVAKARAEKELGKKAKTHVLIEVNSPRKGSGAGETDISLHASNFFPVSSHVYTHCSPSPAWEGTDKTTTKVVIPFTKIPKEDKN